MRGVEEEKQRALEYSERNLKAAEAICALNKSLEDQADTIAADCEAAACSGFANGLDRG